MSQAGEDRRELERLWRAHNAAVRAYARRRIDPDVADDVVAEVFVVAARRLADLPADPLPWLLGCARRVIANQRRGARRRLALIDRITLTQTSAPALPGDGDLAVALAELSARDRELLLLVAWEGLSHAQAGEALGLSANAVGVRLHRARGRLRSALDRIDPVSPLTEEARHVRP